MEKFITIDTFSSTIGTKFTIEISAANKLSLELHGVEDKGSSPIQEQFSLIFEGTKEFFLPQGVYRIEHEQLGENVWFIVPIGRNERNFSYEVAFTRFIPEMT